MSNAAEKQPEPSISASTVMTWYQVTLSAIGDAVLTTDPEGRITYMNPVAAAWSGYSQNEAQGASGQVGIVGPMRMDYSRVIPLVEFTARALSRSFGIEGSEAPPNGDPGKEKKR